MLYVLIAATIFALVFAQELAAPDKRATNTRYSRQRHIFNK